MNAGRLTSVTTAAMAPADFGPTRRTSAGGELSQITCRMTDVGHRVQRSPEGLEDTQDGGPWEFAWACGAWLGEGPDVFAVDQFHSD